MDDAEPRVLEGDAGHRRGVVLVLAGLGVTAVTETADEARIRQAEGLLRQGIGEVVAPLRDVRLERVADCIHAGVGSEAWWGDAHGFRVEDRHLRQHRDGRQGQLRVGVRVCDHRERGHLRPGAARGGDHDQSAGQVMAHLERELADRLGGVDGGPAAERDDGFRTEREEGPKTLGDGCQIRVGLDLVEDLNGSGTGQLGTYPHHDRGGVHELIGHHQDALPVKRPESLQRVRPVAEGGGELEAIHRQVSHREKNTDAGTRWGSLRYVPGRPSRSS